MSKSNMVPGFISKLRAGQPLSLRDRVRLRLWHRKQHRRCLAAWFPDQGPPSVSAGLLLVSFRIIVIYAIAGLILWLLTPLVGLGYAFLVVVLAWILMGAYWLR